MEFARLTKLDMLIIALPLSAEARILQLLRKLWVLPVDIRIAAHANKLRFRPRSYSHVGEVPMLDVVDKPIRDWDSVAKRIFDIVFSIIAIVLLWPIMLGAAIAVKRPRKVPCCSCRSVTASTTRLLTSGSFAPCIRSSAIRPPRRR